jgi:uncharacterized RDD family membrane protein YckC
VAIKVLNSALAGDDDRARFLSEGQLAASITHPHSVYIFGSEEIDGAPVIAMELLSGGTLRDLVQARGPLPPPEAVDIILQVIAGLEAAANTGILHRDVKPANCFVDLQGAVKVGDFGLSITTFAHQQQTGMFLGTPQYAPPEQIRGGALDLRADIYAVGGTLFYLLTGQPPFDDRDLTTLVTRVTTEAPKSPREMRANVSPALADIVTRCLSKDRDQRPATYAALEDLLRPFSSAAPVLASLSRRFAAGLIDSSLFFFAAMPLMMYSLLGGSIRDARWLISYVQIPLVLAYFGVLEGLSGASVGKRLMGLRVALPDGQRASFGRALARVFVYQLPTMANLAMLLLIGKARVDRLAIEHPMLSVATAIPYVILLVLLFVTARRRNGYAALQDLVSGTRVIRAPARTDRLATTITTEAPAAARHSRAHLGPFDVTGSLGRTDAGELVLGFDPLLKRRVWIHVLRTGTPPIPPALRDIARAGRLRWLSGRRTAIEAWDAYEAFDGLALAALPHAQPWRVVRRWLLDLAQEVEAGLRDKTLGSLSVDRVWVTRDGRAKLLDFRAPGALPDGTAADATPTMASAQTWLSAVAARGLTGSTTPLPLSARQLLDRLDARTFETPATLIAELASLLTRPDRVQRWRRAASVFLPAVTPIVFTFFGVIAAMGMQRVAAETPDTDAMLQALGRLDTLTRSTDPAMVAERRNVEIYVAATYRKTLSNEVVWSNPLTATNLMPYRALADRVLADHPTVSPRELAAATASLGPFLKAQQQARAKQQDRARIAPQTATAAMSAIGVAFSAGFGVIFAGVFSGGLFLRAFGLAVVSRDGRRAYRWRAIFRALVAWAPAVVVVWLAFRSRVPFADWTYAKAHLPATIGIVAATSLLIVGAIVATLRPMRGLQDRIAGTWIVPR